MSDSGSSPTRDRTRLGWWLFVGALGVAAAYLAASFVGMLVLGFFGYYATRPIKDHVGARIDSDAIAAAATVLIVLVPIVVLTLYAGFQLVLAVQQALSGSVDPLAVAVDFLGFGELPVGEREALADALQNPDEFVSNPEQKARTVLQTGATVVSTVVSTMLFLALSITLSYVLLRYDDAFSHALRQLFGGRDTTAYAYATAVDADLESVFFGNLLFVVVMAVVAGIAYNVTNLLAPAGLHIPMAFVLAFLTGVASLIPLVVGKVIYVPVLASLAYQAFQGDPSPYVFVGVTAVVYFLALDFLPQTFLQPYISGREINGMMLMFAYLLGPILFGWYGFFLLPILFILMLETVRIVLPELLHGERLTLDATMGESVGADPQDEGPVPPADHPSDGGRATGSDSATGTGSPTESNSTTESDSTAGRE